MKMDEVKETVQQVVEEVEKEAAEKRERRRPRWMKERRVRVLTESARKVRRERNQARAQLRPLVRKRRKHARPVGR